MSYAWQLANLITTLRRLVYTIYNSRTLALGASFEKQVGEEADCTAFKCKQAFSYYTLTKPIIIFLKVFFLITQACIIR